MTIKKRSGRQDVLSGEITFDGTDVVGTTFNGALELPNGARAVGGEFIVIEAGDAALTVDIGDDDTDDRYGSAVNAVTLGRTALTLDGSVMESTGDVGVTFSAQPTQGKFKISVQYVVASRVAFNQGLDYRGEGIRGA